MSSRSRGADAHASGLLAEALACDALERRGWVIKGRRLRNAAGEIDVAAEKDGLLAFVEVKQRQTLAEAARALTRRQKARLLLAAEVVLADNPEWGRVGVRFDLIAVDATGDMRRIIDAIREDA